MQSIARKVISETTNVAPYAAYDLRARTVPAASSREWPSRGPTRPRGLRPGNAHPYGACGIIARRLRRRMCTFTSMVVEEANAPN